MMKFKVSFKVLVILFISLFAFNSNVKAAICNREHISQLKELANQVDVSYEYIDNSDSNETEFSVNQYSVSVNLISDELYLVDKYGNNYFYENSDNGIIRFVINSGVLDLTVHSKKCASLKLRTISMKLPKFNTYSSKEECKELTKYGLDVCDPWYQGDLDEVSFYNTVNKYLNSEDNDDSNSVFNKILEFLESYYIYVLIGIALIILIVVLIVIKRKRSVLE